MNGFAEIWRLPVPSPEIDDGPETRLKYQVLMLSYSVEGQQTSIRFERVVAFCFTDFGACTKDHLVAYDKLVAWGESDWLKQLRSLSHEDLDGARHYRIFIDEVGATTSLLARWSSRLEV